MEESTRERANMEGANFEGGNRDSVNGERLAVVSGQVVLIDQFMLSNQQFLAPCGPLLGARARIEELRGVVHKFGGALIELEPGDYRVYRDPLAQTFAIVSTASDLGNLEIGIGVSLATQRDIPRKVMEHFLRERGVATPAGRVFVDTRCVVAFDLELLRDRETVAEYGELKRSNKDKESRDLLRERGAAVRYGFAPRGDELAVCRMPDGIVGMWPDVTEKLG